MKEQNEHVTEVSLGLRIYFQYLPYTGCSWGSNYIKKQNRDRPSDPCSFCSGEETQSVSRQNSKLVSYKICYKNMRRSKISNVRGRRNGSGAAPPARILLSTVFSNGSEKTPVLEDEDTQLDEDQPWLVCELTMILLPDAYAFFLV